MATTGGSRNTKQHRAIPRTWVAINPARLGASSAMNLPTADNNWAATMSFMRSAASALVVAERNSMTSASSSSQRRRSEPPTARPTPTLARRTGRGTSGRTLPPQFPEMAQHRHQFGQHRRQPFTSRHSQHRPAHRQCGNDLGSVLQWLEDSLRHHLGLQRRLERLAGMVSMSAGVGAQLIEDPGLTALARQLVAVRGRLGHCPALGQRQPIQWTCARIFNEATCRYAALHFEHAFGSRSHRGGARLHRGRL